MKLSYCNDTIHGAAILFIGGAIFLISIASWVVSLEPTFLAKTFQAAYTLLTVWVVLVACGAVYSYISGVRYNDLPFVDYIYHKLGKERKYKISAAYPRDEM